MSVIRSFEDVIAWQKGEELFGMLYVLFGTSKVFFYRDQLLRAALSITNNIAEGFERGTPKELAYFLGIARGSAAEVRSMLLVGQSSSLVSSEDIVLPLSLVTEISRLLTGFITSLQKTENRIQRTLR